MQPKQQTSQPIQAPKPPSNPVLFDERKEHYDALITLFKYAITSMALVITVTGAFVGFTTYTDGKEMRIAMKDQQKELQQSLINLNNKELEMQKALVDLIRTTREDVSVTGQRAISQISTIKDESSSIARIEARKQIDRVFEENKIDDFIVQVAKERIEPQVNKIVDDKIISIRQLRFDKALSDLNSNDLSRLELAMMYFQTGDPLEWSEQQMSRLIKILEEDNAALDAYKNNICVYISLTGSQVVENFFRQELRTHPRSVVGAFSIQYFLRQPDVKNIPLFIEGYKKYPLEYKPNFIHQVLVGSIEANNKEFALAVLNNKDWMDLLFEDSNEIKKQLGGNSPEAVRGSLDGLLFEYKKGFFGEEIKSAYFFTKFPNR